MMALIGGIFVASVIGSLHCAGMCGAFVAIACGQMDPAQRSLRRAAVLQIAYHGGRLLTYMTLGALAGAAGRLLDLAGSLAGLQPIAATLAGAVMIAFGLAALGRLSGLRIMTPQAPRFMSKLLGSAHRAAMRYPPTGRALLIGLLTTLLPCGWLYAFVATAAGTASPLWGALAMAVFWAGTLPMLVAIGAGARSMLGAFGQRLPAAMCFVLVAAGLYTILARGALDPRALAESVGAQQVAHQAPDPLAAPPCCQPAESGGAHGD